MGTEEKVHDFSQRFAAHLNHFSAAMKPVEETLMEYYTSTLSPNIEMFIKRELKPYLVETYEEFKKVEAELGSINKHTTESYTRTFSSKKPLFPTRPKEEHSNELENVVKMV